MYSEAGEVYFKLNMLITCRLQNTSSKERERMRQRVESCMETLYDTFRLKTDIE